MDTHPPLPLTDRLVALGRLWADRHAATLARLGREVVNDGGFFSRLESPGASTTTATLAKFAAFLADPTSWPDREVPEEARAFAHVTGVSAPMPPPSAGIADDGSPQVQERAVAILETLAAERDERPEALAENAIEEACLNEQRSRGFDWPSTIS